MKIKTNLILRIVLLAGLLFSGSLWAETAKGPLEIVKSKDAELQVLLRNKSKDNEKLKTLINSIFDFREMGAKTIKSSVWKDLSEEKQTEFVTEFKRMVENSSVKKLEVYRSDSTNYDEPKIKERSGKAEVTARVWSKGKESVLEYKMIQSEDGDWKAYDLIINGLSTVRNYREQFNSILKDKDFDGLINTLKEKADSYNEEE